MEKLLMDILNAGIALFQNGEGRIKQSLAELDKIYQELREKGEANQSFKANQVRELLNKTVQDAADILSKGGEGRQEALAKLQENFIRLSAEIESSIPEQFKAAARTTLDELKQLLSRKQ
ncbi:phasin-related domain-containing protein [Leptospira ainazelensis]|uniref:phasin-related domain-containing protein n=1 Tax=Leptospira ainazelensis TaxID=2810034 RepID=UPI0038CBFE16